MINADPSGGFVLHTDLGLDRIYVWKFDPAKGALEPADPPFVSLPPGDGPRHFAFHPNNRWCYSIQEEASTLVLFDFNHGQFKPRQTISTLPPEYAGSNFCSGILLSSDGRFLYAGNRLRDSISLFSVDANGELKLIAEEWTRGDYPRSFSFDPSNSFLYCCNQRADNITIFQVDRESGHLRFTGMHVPVGNPSHIAFADLSA
jgi:6-phosphogluconolactonase (cycloisomerase 2 family)